MSSRASSVSLRTPSRSKRRSAIPPPTTYLKSPPSISPPASAVRTSLGPMERKEGEERLADFFEKQEWPSEAELEGLREELGWDGIKVREWFVVQRLKVEQGGVVNGDEKPTHSPAIDPSLTSHPLSPPPTHSPFPTQAKTPDLAHPESGKPPAGSMTAPASFSFSVRRNVVGGTKEAEARRLVFGGEEDSGRGDEKPVVNGTNGLHGLGLGAAFDLRGGAGSGSVVVEADDLIHWLRLHYSYIPSSSTATSPVVTRDAIRAHMVTSVSTSTRLPSLEELTNLVIQAFPGARWELSPADRHNHQVPGLVNNSASRYQAPVTRHRYTQSCGLADLAEIAERAGRGQPLHTMAAALVSPPRMVIDPALQSFGTPSHRHSALDQLAAAAELSERSPIKGRGRDDDEEVTGGVAKKRRMSSARATMVPASPLASSSRSMYDPSAQWRQQPQSYDRSVRGNSDEDDKMDGIAEDEDEVSSEGSDDEGLTKTSEGVHGGMRIIDPSQQPPITIGHVHGHGRQAGSGSTNSSYTSPASVVSHIIPSSSSSQASNGGQPGHIRARSYTNTSGIVYPQNFPSPKQGYGNLAPPLPPPSPAGGAGGQSKKARIKPKKVTVPPSSASVASSSGQARRDRLSPSAASAAALDSEGRYVKPNFTYHELITHEIKRSADGRLQLSEIYKRISERYPYFKLGDSGWQNSIRHNLSLKKCFIREDRPIEGVIDKSGKGGWWTYCPEAVDSGRPGRKGPHGRGTGEYRKGSTPSDIAEKESGKDGEDDYQAWAMEVVQKEVSATPGYSRSLGSEAGSSRNGNGTGRKGRDEGEGRAGGVGSPMKR